MADRHSFIVYPSINHIITCRASRLSKRWPFRATDRPDIEQSMRLHLIERWPRYDPDRGTPLMFTEAALSTWELQQLRNAKREKSVGHHRAQPLESAPESDLVSRDWKGVQGLHSTHELFDRCFKRLDSGEQTLLRLVALHGERVTAYLYRTTRHQIRQRMDAIRDKCRNLKETDQNPDRP